MSRAATVELGFEVRRTAKAAQFIYRGERLWIPLRHLKSGVCGATAPQWAVDAARNFNKKVNVQ